MGGCVALVVAAGRGRRAGGPRPKQYQTVAGVPLLRHGVARLCAHPAISAVRCVIHPDDRPDHDAALAGLPVLPPVDGGAERQESVRLGLESLAAQAPETVLVHDAARPFVPAAVIDRVLAALGTTAGAIPALPVADTLKRGTPEQRIAATVSRDGLWRAQTPQGFHFAPLLAAHRAAAGIVLTDDAAVLEHAGTPVTLVPGSEEAFKVTTPEDFIRAEQMMGQETRVGQGFDVHRFGPGNEVILCGVPVPHNQGLEGHSDADVALHALTDALLGAVGAGDIGQHFPPSDPQWKGCDSAVFVTEALAAVTRAGGTLVNLDLTVICERPRLGPHRAAMRARLVALTGLPDSRLNLKATTTERLGFTGRGEGIAAQAVVAVRMAARA